MAIEVTVRKWGNSFGVVFPKEMVREAKVKVNEKILVEIVREADLSKVFGSVKRKMSGQQFKDLAREGWN